MKPYQRKLMKKYRERMQKVAKRLKRKGFDIKKPIFGN